MELDIENATKVFLSAAIRGQLNRLKVTAVALNLALGGGIQAVFENTKDEYGRGAIHYAASGGRIDVLKYLIQDIKINVNLRDKDGRGAIHCAAYGGRLNVLKYLIEEVKIDVDLRDDNGSSAIHRAASGGSVDVLKYLIEEMEIDVDIKDGYGSTPLCSAAIQGHYDAVEYLLQMGANPEITDNASRGPLHYLAIKGHKHIIPLLLSKGINVDFTNHFGAPLHYAANFGTPDTVKFLMDHGANPNMAHPDAFTPLWASMTSKYWQCTEQLLKGGADPNGGPDGLKPLLLVTHLTSVEATQIIRLLVEAGADPNVTNVKGLKPVEIAAMHGNHRGVEILFPVTSPISSYVDWSPNGILKHVNSEKFKNEMSRKAKENFLEAKSRGTSAFQRKEYWLAVHWYSQALEIYPFDAAVLSNRSLGRVYLNQPDLAYEDATKCMLLRPDWPKAFYRAGVALKLLNRLDDAAEAFLGGLKLAPNNKELEDAFREVSLNRVKATNAPF